jgi:5-methyltetrahydrofolate--homocysteine methyltransferase
MFHEQAEGLKEGGADVLWVETISRPRNTRPPPRPRLADMPWCGTMSFDTAGAR